jgi:hypothetical protein
MLQLKIGNTYVSTKDIEIPVVLRSPLFSEGKGSYLFNFTLPATDELKEEFSYFHRPGRSGASYIKKDLDLKMGQLHYTGTATITEAGPRSYEVSCPIENGDLASLFKTMKLTELDLGGNREAELTEILVKALTSEDMVIHESIPDYYEPILFPIEFDNIIINPDGILNEVGDTLLINETGKVVISFKIEMLRVNYTFVEIRIYRGGNAIFIGDLKEGINYVAAELDVEIYDTLELKIAARRRYDIAPIVYTAANFTIYSGAEVLVLKQGLLIDGEGTDLYPGDDYAVFPVENPKMLDNLEDDTYQIDHVSIKEIYSKHFPVLNYYRDGNFPMVMVGESEGGSFMAFNLFNPFPYLAYVIRRIAETFGITISNNVFEDNDLRQLVIFNLFAENSFITSELIQPRPGFDLADHVPDVQISAYFINLCKLLGIAYDYKSFSKTLRLKYLKDIAADQDYKEFPGMIISKPELKASAYKGYRLKQEVDGDDYIREYFKSLEGLNYKGTVNSYISLPWNNNEINDCYYVIAFTGYYIWNYDPETNVITWVFHSKDFQFVKEEITEGTGTEVLEITSDINAVMINGWRFTDNQLGATLNREWIIPVTHQPGNFDGLPDYFKAQFTNSLLYYHGLRADSQLNLYPLGSHDRYDYAGNPIVYEAVAPAEGYTQDLTLRWDGEHGLYEKRYKGWINLLMRSRGFWKFRANFSPLQLAQIDFFAWYQGQGFKFLVKEVRFNILSDKISTAEVEVLVK